MDASTTPSTVADSQILMHLRRGPSKDKAYMYLRPIFVSNHYTNNNTNPRTLTTLTLIITDSHDVCD